MYKSKIAGKHTKEYNLWKSMYHRCLNTEINKSYLGCTISENFNDFQYFAEWCQHQIGFKVEGFQLDKDILGNNCKIYHEDTCVFVPRQVNCFITKYYSSTKSGVIFIDRLGKYRARIQDLNGKRIHLGLFITEDEAFEVYQKYKKKLAIELVDKYKDQVDSRVIQKLLDIEIVSMTSLP